MKLNLILQLAGPSHIWDAKMRTDDFKEKAFGQFHVLQSELEIRICKTLIALNWIVKLKKIINIIKIVCFLFFGWRSNI